MPLINHRMNFSIEVPAEAIPLTSQNLSTVLTSATSVDQQLLQTSAQQLQNWEKQAGYYGSLQVGLMVIFMQTKSLTLKIVCVYRHFAPH